MNIYIETLASRQTSSGHHSSGDDWAQVVRVSSDLAEVSGHAELLVLPDTNLDEIAVWEACECGMNQTPILETFALRKYMSVCQYLHLELDMSDFIEAQPDDFASFTGDHDYAAYLSFLRVLRTGCEEA